jgi:hypothetical protein
MNIQGTINTVLKAVAVGMSVAVLVFSYLGNISTETLIGLLGLGLFAVSVAALQKKED